MPSVGVKATEHEVSSLSALSSLATVRAWLGSQRAWHASSRAALNNLHRYSYAQAGKRVAPRDASGSQFLDRAPQEEQLAYKASTGSSAICDD